MTETPGAPRAETDTVRVTESIHGTYRYHLSQVRRSSSGTALISDPVALCGAKVMGTAIPLATWGYRGHLNETYCEQCAQSPAGVAAISGALVAKEASR